MSVDSVGDPKVGVCPVDPDDGDGMRDDTDGMSGPLPGGPTRPPAAAARLLGDAAGGPVTAAKRCTPPTGVVVCSPTVGTAVTAAPLTLVLDLSSFDEHDVRESLVLVAVL